MGFGDETSTYDDIFFFAALTEGQDFKLNAIDGNSAYNFEELYVFNLRTTKAIRDNLYLETFYNSVVPVDKLLKFLLSFNVDVPSAVSGFDQNPFNTKAIYITLFLSYLPCQQSSVALVQSLSSYLPLLH